jgi:GTP-binding protein
VGKPNVGKSSLVNRLLGEDRVLVHDMPGTTRDPIDTPFSVGGQDFVLVDTAGLRRRRSVDTLTEAVAAKMARDQLARCDVAVLVIDAGGGATVEDAKIAGLIEESGRATILILNKKDSVPKAQINSKIETTKETLSFLSWAPILLTSAVTGAGVAEIPVVAARVFEQTSRRISTGEVNRFLEGIVADRPPPAGPNGRHVRLYFATQAQIRPPTFVFSTNHPTDVPVSYRRFLANQVRRAYGFDGTPIRIVLRAHRKKRKSAPAART